MLTYFIVCIYILCMPCKYLTHYLVNITEQVSLFGSFSFFTGLEKKIKVVLAADANV